MNSIAAPQWLAMVVLAMSAGCSDAPVAPARATTPIDTTPVTPKPRLPTSLEAVSNQAMTSLSVAPRTAVAEPPAVRVLDQYGQPMAGVTVNFVPYSGSDPGGSVALTAVRSDSAGVASCGQWIVGAFEGSNWLYASIPGAPRVAFYALVLLPDPPGVRYELQSRQGVALRPGETGHLVLSDDGTFRLVWLWAVGTPALYVAVNTGTFTRLSDSLAFSSTAFGLWAFAKMQENVLTFTYDEYLDIGFHSLVVERYVRP